jgi:hypothetical protein
MCSTGSLSTFKAFVHLGREVEADHAQGGESVRKKLRLGELTRIHQHGEGNALMLRNLAGFPGSCSGAESMSIRVTGVTVPLLPFIRVTTPYLVSWVSGSL